MTSVLFLVEDPGAVNLVVPLIPELIRRGIEFEVVGIGPSEPYLESRKISYQSGSGQSAPEILEYYNPKLVAVGTSENLDSVVLEVILLSRNKGIETVGLIDQMCNAEYRFRGRSDASLTYQPDWLFVPDKATLLAYHELGFNTERVVVVGSPHLDLILQEVELLDLEGISKVRQRLLSNAVSDRKVVVFLGEANTGLQEGQCELTEEYTLRGRGASRWRSCIVLEELLDALREVGAPSDPYTVLRLHPKNDPNDFRAYYSEVDLVSSGGTPVELMYAADVVVGMTSMALAEAVAIGRPALSIIPREIETSWLQGSIANIIPCVFERSALIMVLRSLLSSPASKQERSSLSGATHSMVQWIESFIASQVC